MLEQLNTLLRRLAYAAAVISGAAILAMVCLVAADVILRFFHRGLPGTFDIVSYYLMFAVGFLPLALVERVDGMITIDALYTHFGVRLQKATRVGVAAFSMAVYAALTYGTWNEAMKSVRSGAYVDVSSYLLPLWPANLILPVSFGLATLITLHQIAYLAAGGDLDPGMELGADDGDGDLEFVARPEKL